MLNIFFQIVLLYPFFGLVKSVLGSYIVELFLHVGKNINKLFVGFIGRYLILICFFKAIEQKVDHSFYWPQICPLSFIDKSNKKTSSPFS